MTSYTTNLRFTKQDQGANSGTWGTVTNGIFDLMDTAIAGFVSINVSAAGDYTLSSNNGSSDESRNAIIRIGGNPVSAKNVVIPAVSKQYIVECTIGTNVTITIKTNTGTGVNMIAGQKDIVYCDGLNTFMVVENLTEFGITATAGELNILDGATVTVAELNVLDGITATVSELNVLDGITATVLELNVLDGITATVAELNILDGVTVSTGEINFLSGTSINIQTKLNALSSVQASLVNTTAGRIVIGAYTEQWGQYTGGSGSGTIQFPVAFSGAPFSIIVTNMSTGTYITNTEAWTVSCFNYLTQNTNTGGTTYKPFSWSAKGPT